MCKQGFQKAANMKSIGAVGRGGPELAGNLPEKKASES